MSFLQFKNKIIRSLHPRNLQLRLLRLALRGKTVYCPCCQSRYLTFLPAGIEKRANARCLKCGSLERHRAIWLYLQNHTDIFTTEKTILHVAPEIQLYKEFEKRKNIEYHPIDLMPDAYQYGTKTKAMDVTALKYPDDNFDVVICNHVLEHIPDDLKAIQEMYRVLKPEGWAVLNVPIQKEREKTFEDTSITDPAQRLQFFGQPDHVRIYGMDYFQRLQDAGFRVEEKNIAATYTHNEQFKYGIVAKEEMIICHKA